ncbi:MAG: hypothetical protein LUF30_12765, partial [Lachnospiraceae bacterium]|nr:hypothetical protein [Lachnospiraceae bacterium]
MAILITLIDYTNDLATAAGAVLEALVLFWFCGPLTFRQAEGIFSTPLLSAFSISPRQDDGSLGSKIGKISRWKGNGVAATSADTKRISLAVHLLTIATLILLHCQHYRFLLQCPLLTAIVLAYLCLVRQASLKNGLVLSVVFCIVSEISHMFCDDIIRNWLVADLLGLKDGVRENYFNILLYTFFLMGLLRLLKGILFRNDRSRLRWREIMVPFLSMVPFFYMRSYQYEIVPAEGGIDREIYLAMILMAVLSLVLILFNEYSLNDRIDRSEMEKMELLLKQQKEYYRKQDETMRAVNRNYHDLKHVLTLLEATVSPADETSLDSAKNQHSRCDQSAKNQPSHCGHSSERPLSRCDHPATQSADGQTPRRLSPDPAESASSHARALSSDSQNIDGPVGESGERMKKALA